MEIDEEEKRFDMRKIYEKVCSSVWYMKVEGYEMLLKEIIDYDQENLQEICANEPVFENIIVTSINIL